jgi:hypothetical protein
LIMDNVFNLSEGGDLGLSYAFISNNITTEKTLDSGLYRNRKGLIQTWGHWHGASGEVWVKYDSLPAETRCKVDVHFDNDVWKSWLIWNLEKGASDNVLEADKDRFLGYGFLSAEKVAQLMRACGWLRYLSMDDSWMSCFIPKVGIKGKTQALSFVAKVIAKEKLYGFSIKNGRVLERKIRRFIDLGAESLINKHWGNLNAIKIVSTPTHCQLEQYEASNKKKKIAVDIVDLTTGEIFTKVEIYQIALKRMLDLYCDPKKLSLESVAYVYNEEARERGFPTYTPMRVMQLMNMPEHQKIWHPARHGVVASRAVREMIIRRERPKVNELWGVDGTTVQLYVLDEKGKMVKAGYWVFVTDSHTDCIIGWAFGLSETAQLVLRALRMAVQRTMCLPKAIQYDGAKANLSSEVKEVIVGMNAIGLKAQPYNGKSKYIERTIGLLEDLMRSMPNFVGGNITARSLKSRANPDYLKRLLASGGVPDLGTCLDQMRLVIEVFNHKKTAKLGMTRAKAYALGTGESRRSNDLSIVALFWVKRPQDYQYTAGGIAFELERKRYEYVVEDERGVESVGFRAKHLGERFWIRYNPDDLSVVHLYNKNDVHVAQANERYLFQALPTVGEAGRLRTNWDNRKNEVKDGLSAAKALREENERMGFREPNMQLMHKDAYNEAMAYLEDEVNGVNISSYNAMATKPQQKKTYDLYDIDESELMQVLE